MRQFAVLYSKSQLYNSKCQIANVTCLLNSASTGKWSTSHWAFKDITSKRRSSKIVDSKQFWLFIPFFGSKWSLYVRNRRVSVLLVPSGISILISQMPPTESSTRWSTLVLQKGRNLQLSKLSIAVSSIRGADCISESDNDPSVLYNDLTRLLCDSSLIRTTLLQFRCSKSHNQISSLFSDSKSEPSW